MNRTWFGAWAVHLPASDFACAMAALGVLQAGSWEKASELPQAEIIANRLREIEGRSQGALHWRAYRPPSDWEVPPEPFVESWQRFLKLRGGPLRVEVERFSPHGEVGFFWLLSQLSLPTVGVSSIYYGKSKNSPNTRWHWPLRVGFLPDAESQALLTNIKKGLRSKVWVKQLVSLVDLRGGDQCDLLLLPHALRLAPVPILSLDSPPQADCVVVLGRMDRSEVQTMRLVDFLDHEVGTNAIAVAPPSQISPAEWFFTLLKNLSHNEPFDLALANAAGDRSTSRPPLLFASGDWIEGARLSSLVDSLNRELTAEHVQAETVSLPLRLAKRLNVSAGVQRLSDLSAPVTNFVRESFDATTLAHLTRAVAPQLRRAKPLATERHLQARVFETRSRESYKGETPSRVFRAGAVHRVDIRIGEKDAEWLSDPRLFPDELLPSSEKGHRLTVVLSEPAVMPEPQVGHIFLPPAGPSSTCLFFLQALDNIERVQARITVLYRNRVLQTSNLDGPVARNPEQASDRGRIAVTPEVVVSPGMADLDRQGEFGAALVLNHNGGTPQVMKVVNDHAELISIDNLSTFIAKIDDELARADWGASEFRKLSAPGTLELLRLLATHGSLLYRGIVKQQFEDAPLKTAQRIQIIAAKPGTRLPAEYIYELPGPANNATLCPSATEALKTGKCGSDCPKTANYICPLGFWGMSRVIEWHLYRPAAARDLQGRDYALQQEKIAQRNKLHALKRSVVGASARADAAVKGSIAKLVSALRAAGAPGDAVKTWEAWRQVVQKKKPSILVLIPHTDTDAALKVPKLEIGTEQWVNIAQLDESYIGTPKATPIVLLLGCETARQDVTFEDFVSNFAICGAAIIVSSSTLILGRQATVVAAEFVRCLKKAGNGDAATFGDVMVTLRRKMLGKGFPMVLSLSSYGDADWRL